MERARLGKSKSASGFEGLRQIKKHKTVGRLSSDSGWHINGSTSDMFMVEMGQSSVGRAIERPVAKLLADKMYKETESKRKSLSSIARLMRLEGLHSVWHVHKQKKMLSNSRQQNNVSINVEPVYDGQSNGRSSMKQQEFNDVYEDPGFVKRRRSSRWSGSSMLTKSEMALIQRKLDVKHLSEDETTDEKPQDLKELNHTLDLLDSEDLLTKFVRNPDSSFLDHFHDQWVNPSSSIGSHAAVLKPLNSAKYKGDVKAWIRNRDTTVKQGIPAHPKRNNTLLLERHDSCRAHISHRVSNIQSEERHKKNILPTPIVVLKPNPGNMQNAAVCCSSPYHSHGYIPSFRKSKEHTSVGGAEELSRSKKDSYYDAEFSKPDFNEARRLAREITMRIRDACNEGENAMYFGFREYITDESLYDAQKSDFNGESEMFKWSSRNSIVDDNKWVRDPSSESVNGDRKKRLSERWKITHRYQDLEIVGKGSTLGEMLAIPDGEKRCKSYAHQGNDKSSTQLGIDGGSSILGGPSGITHRSGPKNEIQRTSTRSRSLPPTGGRIHRRSTCRDVFTEEKRLMHSDPISCGRSKVTKGYPSHKDFLSSQGSKSRSKKPLPCPPIYIKDMEYSLEASLEIYMEANIKDFSEQQLMFQMARKDDCSGSPVSDIMITEPGNTTLSSKFSQLHPKHSSADNESSASAHDQEDFYLQGLHQEQPVPEEGSPSLHCLGAEPVSSESSKDANHASPVSVFEVPFVEDASSSSESFERVSAELNELRMQLQLLKMESGAHDEISTLITIEKEVAYPSSRAEGWEISYALDVLIHSGFEDFGFDMFRIMWHSPDCPLDPVLFDNLEKKYSDEITGLRSERRLLFDRINSALLEIFQKHDDLRPWVMPKLSGLLSTWQKERAKDALEKLINQESANGQVTERILDREMQWGDPTEEIALMGNEIEKLLIDDIIIEFLCD